MILVCYFYNGLKIYYDKFGEGEPVVFLHGWGCSSDVFKVVGRSISKKYMVYLIDFPGFGKSTLSDYVIDVKMMASIIDGFFKAFRINNPVIIGHSYGGRVAAEYARYNKNISKLVLIDSAGIKRFSFIKFFKVRLYKFKKSLYKITKRVMKYNELITRSGSSDYVSAGVIQKRMLIAAVNYNQKHVFKCIKCETLLIWGSNDKSTPLKDGKLINRLIQNSSLVIIPNSGHFPFVDNYPYFIKVLESYLGV